MRGKVNSLTTYLSPSIPLPSSMETCQLLAGFLDTLAAKYPSTKFVSIVGDKVSCAYTDVSFFL